jgi:hypothetical protein
MMTMDELLATLDNDDCPSDLIGPLAALWHDAKDDWHTAHGIVQSESDAAGCWVHAYLHRQEGDLANANYWYRRASRSMPDTTLQEEWNDITATLLDR